jgi:hypothetical protein
MQNKEMIDASANIAATAKALEKLINEPKHYNSFGSSLMGEVVRQLELQASTIREIEYMYGV